MTTSCCCCGGELEVLGDLGTLRWYRCRACGMDQSERAPEFEHVPDQPCWAFQPAAAEPPQYLALGDEDPADLCQSDVDGPQCDACGGHEYAIELRGRADGSVYPVARCLRCNNVYKVMHRLQSKTQGG